MPGLGQSALLKPDLTAAVPHLALLKNLFN